MRPSCRLLPKYREWELDIVVRWRPPSFSLLVSLPFLCFVPFFFVFFRLFFYFFSPRPLLRGGYCNECAGTLLQRENIYRTLSCREDLS